MANGNSDRMIGGQENEQAPLAHVRHAGSEPPGQVSLARQAWERARYCSKSYAN